MIPQLYEIGIQVQKQNSKPTQSLQIKKVTMHLLRQVTLSSNITDLVVPKGSIQEQSELQLVTKTMVMGQSKKFIHR